MGGKTITTKIKEPKINYFKNINTGKYENDEYHYCYIHGYCMVPFGKKRNSRTARQQLLHHKKQLEKEGKTFPFKRVLSERVIRRLITEFEWEKHYLESLYDEANDISNYVNEYNLEQIKRKTKRINNLNNVLDALQNIITRLAIKAHTTLSQQEISIDDNTRAINDVLTQLGYLYRTLETLHETGSAAVNTLQTEVTNWTEIKERMQTHHNLYTTDEEFLKAQFKAIDYYFDNYEN